MRSFTTTGPVALIVRFASGRLMVRTDDAEDGRTAASVDVRPGNPDSSADVEHAAATSVEQHGDTIEVIVPATKGWFGRNPRLDVRVIVPPGSALDVDVKSADVQLAGRLGRVEVSTASGDVALEHADELHVRTASGDVTGRSVGGNASVNTASGDLRLESIDGSAELATASGDIDVGSVAGEARVRSASGDVVVKAADGSAGVRTASGDVRIDMIRRGSVEIDTASGDVELGVAKGTAAWLDVQALSGKVSSTLEPTDAPADDADKVSIHAHTLSGDITLHRAPN
jgi:Putative adhesin